MGERDVLEDRGPGRRFGHEPDGGLRGRLLLGHARQLARWLLARVGFGRERRIHVDEGLHDVWIERFAALLSQQTDRRVEAHGLVVRALRHERVEVIDRRQNSRAERDVFGLEPRRIAFPVPAFVMAENQRRDRIRERHAADDFGPDLRVNADLLELLLRQRARLRQNVLRDGELADVVEQRGRLQTLSVVGRHPERASQSGGVHLHAADVALRRLILGVDREGQRFDRRQMQVRNLLHVPLLILDASEVHLIRAVREIERGCGERRHPVPAPVDDRRGHRGGARADEVARRAPQEVLVPDARDRLPGRQADRRRDERRVAHKIGRRRPDERLGDRQQRERLGRRPSAEPHIDETCRFDRQHERRHAEQRPVRRGVRLRAKRALAPRAGGSDEHRGVGPEQEHGREIHRVGHRHRRSARDERQAHLQRGRERGEKQQRGEKSRFGDRMRPEPRAHDDACDEHGRHVQTCRNGKTFH